MDFSRHTISLKGRTDIRDILESLSRQGLVAVNIAASLEENSRFLSQENLDAILTASPESLFVEALSLLEFMRLIRRDVGDVIELSLELRARLRTEYVNNLGAEIQSFLGRIEKTRLMIGCYVLQNENSAAAENSEKLQRSLVLLSESSFAHDDNVRCMDDLQYHILPILKLLQKIFRK